MICCYMQSVFSWPRLNSAMAMHCTESARSPIPYIYHIHYSIYNTNKILHSVASLFYFFFFFSFASNYEEMHRTATTTKTTTMTATATATATALLYKKKINESQSCECIQCQCLAILSLLGFFTLDIFLSSFAFHKHAQCF